MNTNFIDNNAMTGQSGSQLHEDDIQQHISNEHLQLKYENNVSTFDGKPLAHMQFQCKVIIAGYLYNWLLHIVYIGNNLGKLLEQQQQMIGLLSNLVEFNLKQ